MSKTQNLTLKIILPLFFLALGAGIFWYFYVNKPQAKNRPRPFLGALVEVQTLRKETREIQINTHGMVHAKERVTLTSRISGVVSQINPTLVEGHFLQKGEILLKINPTIEANRYYTEVAAPFNGVVQTKEVSIGQYVTPGFVFATIIGSDQAQVRVDLPLREMARLPIQQSPNNLEISAKVTLTYGHRSQSWEAIVKRNLLELTPKGMMAQLMIEVNDPFRLSVPKEEASIPLFIGSFVDVVIPSETLTDVFIIPAYALRDQNTVYLKNKQILEIRAVEVTYVNKDEVFISQGLQEGEQLILSPLKGAASGMKVRTAAETKQRKPDKQRREA